MDTPKVYGAIAAVMHEMSQAGIGKGRKNVAQGFAFRGVDDVYNALAPILAKHKLCILPRVTGREMVERTTKSGSAQFYTYLTMEFDIVAEDGSKHTVCTIGEAQDTGDKSTNKAMSAAYKYACFMAFCIPVEGTPDADADTPEPSEPRRRETKAEADNRRAGHHASWEADKGRFFAKLADIGKEYGYETVAAFCVKLGRPRPSEMSDDQRTKLLQYLSSDRGREDFAAFVRDGSTPNAHAAK